MRIVLGVSAGIAAYKSVHLARLLTAERHQVDVIPTPASLEFVGRATWEAISSRPVTTSVFEGIDEVRHVRLGQHADLIVVAPATADLLARIRNGMANDLLTSTVLASLAPKLLVPAMHTEMWNNAATADNVATLRRRGITVMEPAVGRLTGADSGPGRLPEPEEIHRTVRQMLGTTVDSAATYRGDTGRSALEGRHIVVTAGGTREPLDPVRYLGNRSSGKQGFALAEQAAAAGATVHLIAGITEAEPPSNHARITVERIETASQLQHAVRTATTDSDALMMAAAVADFRPADYRQSKIKKTDDGENPVITLERNPDILADVVQDRLTSGKGPEVILGFAAETGSDGTDVFDLAQEKLDRKGCDLLVLNRVGEGVVFGRDDTEIHVLASARTQHLLGETAPLSVTGSKAEAANAVVSRLAQLLQAGSPSLHK